MNYLDVDVCVKVTHNLTFHLRDIAIQNLSDLDLSRSLKVQSKSAVRFSIYDVILVINSNI